LQRRRAAGPEAESFERRSVAEVDDLPAAAHEETAHGDGQRRGKPDGGAQREEFAAQGFCLYKILAHAPVQFAAQRVIVDDEVALIVLFVFYEVEEQIL